MNRAEAWALVTEYAQSESLRRHMLAVECAMRAYVPRFGGDPEVWGVAGLLYDFDYEQNPGVSAEGHPIVGARMLRERGVSGDIVRAILAHAEEITGVAPETPMEKTLVAVALVRLTKCILDVRLKSVKPDTTLDYPKSPFSSPNQLDCFPITSRATAAYS